MKKILISLSMVAVVATVAVYATRAYFTSSATVAGSTFTAGTMSLKVDSNPDPGLYNWQSSFVNPFNPFANVKPGDSGSQIIDLKNAGNVDGIATIKFDVTSWSALGDNLIFTVAYDSNNDGTFETAVASGPLSVWNHNTYTLGAFTGASNDNGGLAGKMSSVKISWSVPTTAGNDIQGQSVTLDTTFGLQQQVAQEPKSPVFALTQASVANTANQNSESLPWYTYEINGLNIDFTLHNPTTKPAYFDFAIDGDPGQNIAGLSNIVISEGPLSGQTVGNLYSDVEVGAGQTMTVTKTGTGQIKVAIHYGAEQLWYLDWATFTAN